ncbi:MAG: FtsX-like permease family protein [Segetibacter sp.]
MNLTTARSLQRVREVGVRKVLGAERTQLTFQFITESLLFFLTTLPVALLLAKISWPLFSKTINIEADENILFTWRNVMAVFIISSGTGILSGLYPSVFLSKLQPVHILKDWQKSVKINLGIRKSLIVLQLVISVVLIISTIVVNKQLQFINTLQLGFNKEHLIVLPYQPMENKALSFKNELLQNKNIKQVSIASWNVGERYGASSSMDNPADTTKTLNFSFLFADFDFIKIMQMQIVEGRDFSTDYVSDIANIDSSFQHAGGKLSETEWMNIASSRGIILTENTAEAIGLKKPFTGQVLKLPVLQGTVIGVVKEFQGLSLHEKSPLVILKASREVEEGFTYLRINPTNISATLSFIQDKWKQFFPDSTYNFSFVNERLQKLYTSERRLASLFSLFAVMAILIACSGLFSLVALSVQQRTKEIGIRKVFGSNSCRHHGTSLKRFYKTYLYCYYYRLTHCMAADE